MRKSGVLFAIFLALAGGDLANAAIMTNGVIGPGPDDGLITLVYNPADGNLSIDAAGKEITALEIRSQGQNVISVHPANRHSLIESWSPSKMFILKSTANRFVDLDLGILRANMTKEEVGADLTVSGALYPSGGLGTALGTVDLMYVPEPSSTGLLCAAAICVLGAYRQRRTDSIKCR